MHWLSLPMAISMPGETIPTANLAAAPPRPVRLQIPAEVSGLSNVTSIAAGATHNLAISLDGSVWAWGDNLDGQLGNGITGGVDPTPTEVSALPGPASQAAGGSEFSFVLASNGGIWVFGSLPIPGAPNAPSAISLPPLSANVIDAGGRSMWFKPPGGEVIVGVGDNSQGQLAGTVSGLTESILDGSAIPAVQVDVGPNDSAFLLQNGSLLACGSNSNGQLGNGTTVDSASPVTVSNWSSE